jgi:parallel beta-helix repeat protein
MRRKSFIIPFTVLLLVFGNTVLVAERPCQSIQAASFTHVAGFEVGFSASSALGLNKTYGGAGSDFALDLVQTIDGGYALVGTTGSFGAGGTDVWLVRTDSFGNHLWNKTYGGAMSDSALALVQTADGGCALVGYTYSSGASRDAWLVKVDALGNHLWNRTYGGVGEDRAYALVQTDDGGYALACSTDSFGAGSDDFWLVKTVRDAPTIIVPDDYLTIQEAINGASSGDTIFVRSGIYCEHVVVNKTVSLVGENVSATIVDGGGSGNVFTINRNNVSISSFTIRNSGTILGNAGLRLDNVGLCSISGNRVRDNFAGIWLEESSENLILANDITANVDDGIVFNYSHNNTISGNHIALHEYFGIVINWSNNNTICWNNITQTFGPSHGDGINLWRSSHNSIFQNQVEENNRYGIRIEVESNDNTLSDNKIGNCLTGLQVYNYSNYNDIRGNRITTCSNGIELNRYITYAILSCNTIENSGVGININTWSVNNTISRNRLAANVAGIRFYYASLNEVFLNHITDSDLGVALQYSQSNMFYSNNFMNNTQQASVSIGYANAWDGGYPDGGNYWSDYVSPDLFRGPYQNVTGGDGIGDNPCVIDVSNRDNYPFMLLSVCNVSQTPEGGTISPADEVRITATITHLYSVERAMLNYTATNSTGTFHLSLNMTNAEGDVWNATIPAFPLGTNVTYIIIGQDSEGNTISSQQQGYALEYQVIPEFSSILMLAPLAIITLLIAVVSKRKRAKNPTTRWFIVDLSDGGQAPRARSS